VLLLTPVLGSAGDAWPPTVKDVVVGYAFGESDTTICVTFVDDGRSSPNCRAGARCSMPPVSVLSDRPDVGQLRASSCPRSCSKTPKSELGGSLESALHNQIFRASPRRALRQQIRRDEADSEAVPAIGRRSTLDRIGERCALRCRHHRVAVKDCLKPAVPSV
jgi:hypothetical protein